MRLPTALRPTFRLLSSRRALHKVHLRTTPTARILPVLPQMAQFSTTARRDAKKGKKRQKKDVRITQIRYHLQHPKTPRPLRFSRLRALRHWTIHRAWQLYKAQQRKATELELERQYNSMREACEALRIIDENGNTHAEGAESKSVGRLYRLSMNKTGVWDNVPIEYARCQVDFPSREGWNHDWSR